MRKKSVTSNPANDPNQPEQEIEPQRLPDEPFGDVHFAEYTEQYNMSDDYYESKSVRFFFSGNPNDYGEEFDDDDFDDDFDQDFEALPDDEFNDVIDDDSIPTDNDDESCDEDDVDEMEKAFESMDSDENTYEIDN